MSKRLIYRYAIAGVRSIRRYRIHLGLLLILVFTLSACIEKSPLVNDINSNDDDFSAGEINYLPLKPLWGNERGLQWPVEISIAQDGHVFIADSMANSIFVFDQSGTAPDIFSPLQDLKTEDNLALAPIDVDIDQKMNVYYTDGGVTIYCWNMYWNLEGVDSVSVRATFEHTESGVHNTLDYTSQFWHEMVNSDEWRMLEDSVIWSTAEALIDSILSPHLFTNGRWAENVFADQPYYNSRISRFTALSASESEPEYIFAADSTQNRIIRIRLDRTLLLSLSNKRQVWAHRGIFQSTVVEEGQGTGFANNPQGMDIDYAGNIYYSQFGDYYGVHKVAPIQTGDYLDYKSVFEESKNPIIEQNLFDHPSDVAVDQNQMIYVANSGAQEIQVFQQNGDFFKKAGVDEIRIDSTFTIETDTGTVQVDSFDVEEIKGQLEQPRAVTVDERGVIYVCDTPAGRIARFRLSNILDEDLQPDE